MDHSPLGYSIVAEECDVLRRLPHVHLVVGTSNVSGVLACLLLLQEQWSCHNLALRGVA
jgi:hypothetical protein